MFDILAKATNGAAAGANERPDGRREDEKSESCGGCFHSVNELCFSSFGKWAAFKKEQAHSLSPLRA